MRILLATGIYPPDAGGPATYTRALARALSSSELHQVEVVCYGEKDEISDADGYPVERIGRNRSLIARYWNFFHAVRRRASACDVVYLQGPVSEGFPGTLAAIVSGKLTVMKVVGDYAWEIYAGSGGSELLDEFLTHRHSGKIWILEMIERLTAKCAKKIIVPSKYLRSVVEKWGATSDKIQVIYNAENAIFDTAFKIEDGKNIPIESREDIRKDFGLPSDALILLTVARAVPWKSCDFIIKLLPQLPTNVHFVIVGDGPAKSDWEAVTKVMHVENRVHFRNRVSLPNIKRYYRAVDLFVLPSGYEGFAHVIPEAVSSGLHCFVSDKGGNTEAQELLRGHVTVLPYLNRDKWLEALKNDWPSRSTAFVNRTLHSESEMIQEAIALLESVRQ